MNAVITLLLWVAYFLSLFFAVFWLITFITSEDKKPLKKLSRFPLVSVIIPAYNESANIAKTINSVLKLDYPSDQLEIIVVNDGSKDDTAAKTREVIAAHPDRNVRLISQVNRGKGAALNTGLRQCRGEFFVCLDADSFPNPDALQVILPLFDESDDVAAGLPALKVAKGGNILQKMQRYEYIVNMFYKELMAKLDCIRVTPGPFSVYKTAIIKRLGGFDEHNNITEDLEMALRLQKFNYRLAQTLDTYVETLPPQTLRGLYAQRNRWYKGSILNTLDYWKMLFNRRYGDFGVMQMPTTLISGAITILIVCSMVYYALKPVFIKLYHLSLVNFDFMTFVNNFLLNFHLLVFGLLFFLL